MADLDIIGMDSKKAGKAKLPVQFQEEIRSDLIRRAFHYYMSKNRQPYGASPEAGKRPSVRISKRRRDYRGCYGIGISRVPRKIHSRRGRRMNWTGAFAPGTVGGRRAHPPKAEKQWDHKLNVKERKKSIRSAIAASLHKELVAQKHRVPEHYPVVLGATFENIERTIDVRNALVAIGLGDELERASVRNVRAGRGKMRGRKYKVKRGPLLVVGSNCKLLQSAGNIPGVDVADVKDLNVLQLAPGAEAGRLVYFTQPALEQMEKQGLFLPPKQRVFKAPETLKTTKVEMEPAKKTPAKKTPAKPAKKAPAKKEGEQ